MHGMKFSLITLEINLDNVLNKNREFEKKILVHGYHLVKAWYKISFFAHSPFFKN